MHTPPPIPRARARPPFLSADILFFRTGVEIARRRGLSVLESSPSSDRSFQFHPFILLTRKRHAQFE